MPVFHQYNNLIMQKQFLTTLKRKSHRERFYSSMNYDEFTEIYGPPSPLFKPLEDPTEDIPLLDLEQPALLSLEPEQPVINLLGTKMETIFEIEGSQNFTVNFQKSPRAECFLSNCRSRESKGVGSELQSPKRMRIRMRSQSDNSEYLIFNFLERINEKGRKRIKFD